MTPEYRERVKNADDTGGDVRTLSERDGLIIDWLCRPDDLAD